MNITALFTGGTIGSKSDGTCVDVCTGATEPLFAHYHRQHTGGDVKFSCKTILSTLSENMSGDHWIAIAEEARAAAQDSDGLIITHGTDTLAYTAVFLSLALADLSVPVLLVSSNQPLENPNANGYENFSAAVDFIRTERTPGVFVPFSMGGQTLIHLGSRLTESHPFTHDFASVGGVYYGKMENGHFVRNNSALNPTPDMLACAKTSIFGANIALADVLMIRPYPDLNYEHISLESKPKAILHGLYHSGTACASAERQNRSVLSFAKRCAQAGIDLYAAPIDTRNTPYESTKEMSDAGIKFLPDMSIEAAYVKLKIAYRLYDTKDAISAFLSDCIAFENL